MSGRLGIRNLSCHDAARIAVAESLLILRKIE
jgi:hypothetical protein